ncbi:MAG TPA: AEC family transporter [Candidatus Scybalocola faecavium]|nr:AEC family transporter [Candidatus Scybalocola faecavium]
MIPLLLTRQIIILFLMMGCGYALVKLGLLCSGESQTLSVISIYIILPCVIINAFQIDYSPQIRDGFLLAVGAAIFIHILLFLITFICQKIWKLGRVEKASLIYSNSGNLIIPLVTAVLGKEWVIYASAFLCVQMVIMWTHGQSLMQGKAGINLKKILTNINLISIIIGMVLFLGQISLPSILSDTLDSLASLIGPVSMIMIGMLLGAVRWKEVFSNKRIYLITFLKMILLPGIVLIALRLLAAVIPMENTQTILLISLLAVITPSAVTVTQMAQIYHQDAAYASSINVLTTLVCIVTMPLMVTLYMV